MEDHSLFEKFKETVYRVYDKYYNLPKRDTIIEKDDITNLKIQIGLYGDNSQKFIETLPITGKP